MSPNSEGGTNPYFWTTEIAGTLVDLGIRHVRDDCVISRASLKGGDADTSAALAHNITAYRAFQAAGVGIGAIVSDPEALDNLVRKILPRLDHPLDWVEGMNEMDSTYLSSPGSWKPYPAPPGTPGWGTLRGDWESGLVYDAGDLVGRGHGRWVAVGRHLSSGATDPAQIATTDIASAPGSSGGLWIASGYEGPWVPMWAYHSVLLSLAMRGFKSTGRIHPDTLICSGGTVSGGHDNMVAHHTLTASGRLLLGRPDYGCDIGQIHGYGVGGDLYCHNSNESGILDNLLRDEDLRAAYPGGIALGETGFTTTDAASEVEPFVNAMCSMVEGYRVGCVPRSVVYDLTDFYLGGGRWPSPVPPYLPNEEWEAFGLCAIRPGYITGHDDLREKAGTPLLKSFLQAVTDRRSGPTSNTLGFTLTPSETDMRPPLLLSRSNGEFDLIVSTAGNTRREVRVEPPDTAPWTSVGVIDPARGAAVQQLRTKVTAADPYAVELRPYPVVVRIRP
jgi:hypothetical protein